MHRERQKLVTPIWVPDDEFVQVWQQEEYTGKEFAEGIPEFYTEKGERVRSKSEVIIADLFNKNGIFPGENLILTYETKKNPLNQKVIKMMIRRYLK